MWWKVFAYNFEMRSSILSKLNAMLFTTYLKLNSWAENSSSRWSIEYSESIMILWSKTSGCLLAHAFNHLWRVNCDVHNLCTLVSSVIREFSSANNNLKHQSHYIVTVYRNHKRLIHSVVKAMSWESRVVHSSVDPVVDLFWISLKGSQAI